MNGCYDLPLIVSEGIKLCLRTETTAAPNVALLMELLELQHCPPGVIPDDFVHLLFRKSCFKCWV